MAKCMVAAGDLLRMGDGIRSAAMSAMRLPSDRIAIRPMPGMRVDIDMNTSRAISESDLCMGIASMAETQTLYQN
jgi:hypothetical protein